MVQFVFSFLYQGIMTAKLVHMLKKERFEPISEIRHSVFHGQEFRLEFLEKTPISNFRNSGKLRKKLKDSVSNLVKSFTIPQTEISLICIDGVLASKSEVKHKYDSMYKFGDSIDDLPKSTRQIFDNNIKHSFGDGKIRMTFSIWDNKIFWENYDGSHHAAIAIYQCVKEAFSYKVPCSLNVMYMYPNEASFILKNFDLYLMKSNHQLTKFLLLFHETGIFFQFQEFSLWDPKSKIPVKHSLIYVSKSTSILRFCFKRNLIKYLKNCYIYLNREFESYLKVQENLVAENFDKFEDENLSEKICTLMKK